MRLRESRDVLKKPARQSPPVFSAGSSSLRQSQCYGIAPSALLDPTKHPRRLCGTGLLQNIPGHVDGGHTSTISSRSRRRSQ